MRNFKKLILAVAGVLAVTAGQVQAAFTTWTDTTVGGFVPNSAAGTPAFLAAIGTPDVFLDFSLDKFGGAMPAGSISGTDVSFDVVFSSKVSTIGFGGGVSALVNSSGAGPASEIGPFGSWDGILDIDFLAAGNTASIVGFGTVLLGAIEEIRIFDQFNVLAATYPGVAATFGFFGIEGTGGSQIGRIELDGDFFAIQDLQFDFGHVGAVPEPASLAMWGLGALGMMVAVRKRRQSKLTA